MSLLNDPDFVASPVGAALMANPLGFIDIGARWGVQSFADPVADLTAVMAFEPDRAAIPELEASLGKRWKQARVECVALGASPRKAALHLFAHPNNHSLLSANNAFRARYGVKSLADAGTTQVDLVRLDDVLFGTHPEETFWGELLKLDVQGAEIEVLSGAMRTLAERTVAIVAEFSFIDIYQDQPRFSDLERFLNEAGFTFYGFHSIQGWSQKYLDKRRSFGKERVCFGDAVFLRDPFPSSTRVATLSPRQYAVLYLSALLLKYYDFAIELAANGDYGHEEAERLIRLARRQAEHLPESAIAKVESLLARMKAQPADANLEFCRFIDAHRTYFDVADAVLPRNIPTPRRN